ncbi:DnaB-like helicase N-terminal domain-containing protein, partial [Acinetobacter baumannii]
PDRLPPQNRDAERSVLGSMLRENDAIDLILSTYSLQADHFYADAHRKIYEAMLALYDNSSPVDLVTLADELKRRGYIED